LQYFSGTGNPDFNEKPLSASRLRPIININLRRQNGRKQLIEKKFLLQNLLILLEFFVLGAL
jgi:hypothetical protein